MSVPLAHFGHWYVQIMFVAPAVVLVAVLSFQSWRENRRPKRRPARADHPRGGRPRR